MFWVVLIAALGGAVPTFSKMSLTVFPPFTFVFLRFITAALILIPLMIKAKDAIKKRDIVPMALISLFGTGNVVFFAFGVRQTTATVSQILYAAVPIIATILSLVILKTSISKLKAFGVLIGFIGVITIILGPSGGKSNTAFGTITGNLLVLLAVISYAMYTVLSKKLQQKSSPLSITTMMVITTIVVQSFLIPIDISKYQEVVAKISISSVLGIVYVGAVGTAIYFLLYQKVIQKVNPLYASMIFYLQPIFTFIWSYILLGERLTINIIIGSIIALIGAGLVMKKEPRIISSEDVLNEKK